jgi:hypothetical protein
MKFWAISWLEMAINKFKDNHEVIHTVNDEMTIGDFIRKWLPDDVEQIIEIKD